MLQKESLGFRRAHPAIVQHVFTAKEMGLADHKNPVGNCSRSVGTLQSSLPLQVLKKVHPVPLIGSGSAKLITLIAPVCLGPPEGQAAERTLLRWITTRFYRELMPNLEAS